MRFLVALVLVLLVASPAFAAGNIVGPQKCAMSWVQPPTSDDGSALTDLSGWRIELTRTSGNYANATKQNVTAPSPTVTAPLPMAFNCKPMNLADGQWYGRVVAVDLALNESYSPEVPFVWDARKPSAPTGFTVE